MSKMQQILSHMVSETNFLCDYRLFPVNVLQFHLRCTYIYTSHMQAAVATRYSGQLKLQTLWPNNQTGALISVQA